jgi:hypothetical protein
VCFATGGICDLIYLGENRFDRHYTQNRHHFQLNGYAALEELIRASAYKSIEQAVASLTLFSHPETVRQTGGKALFPTIHNAARRRQKAEVDGRLLAYDDNKSPTDAFL